MKNTGTRIYNLESLMSAVRLKRAVFVPKSVSWSKPRPAAFVINLQGFVLLQMFIAGLYIYEKGDQKDDG